MNPALKGLMQFIFVALVYGGMAVAIYFTAHPANQPEGEEEKEN
jgi:hypothetical protein